MQISHFGYAQQYRSAHIAKMFTILLIYNNCPEALCPWQTQKTYQIKAQLCPMLFLLAGKTESFIIKTPNSIYRGSVQGSLCVGSATQKLLILYVLRYIRP